MGPKVKTKGGDVGADVGAATQSLGLSDAERRRAPRVFVDLEVDYASEENYLFAYITDISATGIFVRTTTPEQPGTHLNLRFQLPPPETNARRGAKPDMKIEVEGEVIWVNPYRPGAPDNLHPGMGVRFVGLDDEVRDQLLELIRRFAYLS
ncbi:MAG: TIGR02266 family protein [Deltaproteobacteria bacterium]|nr:TIGR02266 family protein [Deltaproteobacteria bacterium]